VISWRVYYAGGGTFSSDDGSAFEAPAVDVLCAVKADSTVGRVVLSGSDYYWWDSARSEWFGGDAAGFWQYMMFGRGPKAVLFGRYVSNEEFHDCMVTALADPDFAAKTARHSSEAA
jgi:hypothetical protein